MGASCHLNLAIRRARVLSSGSPPTSVGHAKKSEGAAGVFGNGQDQKARSDAALTARLYQEIGQLKVERDFLSERSGP